MDRDARAEAARPQDIQHPRAELIGDHRLQWRKDRKWRRSRRSLRDFRVVAFEIVDPGRPERRDTAGADLLSGRRQETILGADPQLQRPEAIDDLVQAVAVPRLPRRGLASPACRTPRGARRGRSAAPLDARRRTQPDRLREVDAMLVFRSGGTEGIDHHVALARHEGW